MVVNISDIYKRIRDYFVIYSKYGVIGNTIRIEASSICQLKCPVCPQAKGEMGTIGKGYLKLKDFKKFIDNHPYFRNIELSNYGEIFLNPELKDIIRYAYIKKINLTARNGVNLNTTSEETIESLVKYQFKAMSISINGATNNTYKIYQREGNFDNVIENIKKINYYKKKYNIKFPELQWQFVIFGHNEHELPIAKKMAKELNMRFVTKFNWSPTYSPVKNKGFVRRETATGVASRHEYEQKTKIMYLLPCYQLWNSPQINWDGRLLGCCINTWGDFGNAFTLGLAKCIKSEKYIYAKKMLLDKKGIREDIPCFYCDMYKKLQAAKNPSKMFKKIIFQKLLIRFLEKPSAFYSKYL